MSLAVGDTAIAGGRIRRIAPDGEVRIIDEDGVFRMRRGNPSNLFEDIGANLANIQNNAHLDRVTLIDIATGGVLATYERTGAGWERR